LNPWLQNADGAVTVALYVQPRASRNEIAGEQGEELKQAKGGFLTRKSTFKVIAREQPDFEIELSGTESLISPFLEEMESVLDKKGLRHEVVTIARPGLGKAKQTEQ